MPGIQGYLRFLVVWKESCFPEGFGGNGGVVLRCLTPVLPNIKLRENMDGVKFTRKYLVGWLVTVRFLRKQRPKVCSVVYFTDRPHEKELRCSQNGGERTRSLLANGIC